MVPRRPFCITDSDFFSNRFTWYHMATLGSILKQARENSGVSQRELAERSGVPLATIKKIESDTIANPSWHAIRDLAVSLRLSLDTLAHTVPPRDDRRGGKRA